MRVLRKVAEAIEGSSSEPPTDLTLKRTGYVLNATLPDSVAVDHVAPWFGQPGGAVVVKLDRVIAAYVDLGMVSSFTIGEQLE